MPTHLRFLAVGEGGKLAAIGKGEEQVVQAAMIHFLTIPELIATTDPCATLPTAIFHRLVIDPRLKVLESPADLGRIPCHMAWHICHRGVTAIAG